MKSRKRGTVCGFFDRKEHTTDMRTQLQLQGIVFILFGMLLVLIAISGPVPYMLGGILQVVLLLLALIMGIMGLILSLSKDKTS